MNPRKKKTLTVPKKVKAVKPPPPPKPKVTRVSLEKAGDRLALAILDFKERLQRWEAERKRFETPGSQRADLWKIISGTVSKGLLQDAALTLMHNADEKLKMLLEKTSVEQVKQALKKACEV